MAGTSSKSEVRKNKIRSNIQASIEHAEREKKRELLRKRIELARAGSRSYQARRTADAVKAFHSFLKVLEASKSVKEGGILPSHFDQKKEIIELLLISGVYWDLVRLYDNTTSGQKRSQFMHYLEKYVLFSKGMPYQSLCAETLRKYISNDKAVHRKEFKQAYKSLTGSSLDSRCFVATSLSDVSQPMTLYHLRNFRDQILRKHPLGRAFIKWYYRNGPQIAGKINRFPQPMRRFLGRCLDKVAYFLSQSVNERSNPSGPEDRLAIRKADPK